MQRDSGGPCHASKPLHVLQYLAKKTYALPRQVRRTQDTKQRKPLDDPDAKNSRVLGLGLRLLSHGILDPTKGRRTYSKVEESSRSGLGLASEGQNNVSAQC